MTQLLEGTQISVEQRDMDAVRKVYRTRDKITKSCREEFQIYPGKSSMNETQNALAVCAIKERHVEMAYRHSHQLMEQTCTQIKIKEPPSTNTFQLCACGLGSISTY